MSTVASNAPIEDRLARLEERVAQIGQEADGVYEVLAAKQFQLYDKNGEQRGLWAADGDTVTIEMSNDSGGFVVLVDAGGASLGLTDSNRRGRVLLHIDEEGDGGVQCSLTNGNGVGILELRAYDIGGMVSLSDSQGRRRIVLGTGGNEEDAALLSLTDADAQDAVYFRVPAVSGEGPSVEMAGWPDWVTKTVEKLWGRLHGGGA